MLVAGTLRMCCEQRMEGTEEGLSLGRGRAAGVPPWACFRLALPRSLLGAKAFEQASEWVLWNFSCGFFILTIR